MLAVALALLSAAGFGGYSVMIRWGQPRARDLDAGTAATMMIASAGIVAAAAAVGPLEVQPRELWPFALIGLLAPGLSQFLFQRSIRLTGAARPTLIIGMTPLISVTVALVALGEPARLPLLVGAALVVGGSALLVYERTRPAHLRRLGLALAGFCTLLFAARDNLVRLAGDHVDPPALQAGAASVLVAALVSFLFVALPRGSTGIRAVGGSARAMLPAGVCFAVAYASLIGAFLHGRVSVVTSLGATQSLWVVLLTALVLGDAEKLGPRVLVAGALVVAGSAVVGATR